jgi:hypothetical protein
LLVVRTQLRQRSKPIENGNATRIGDERKDLYNYVQTRRPSMTKPIKTAVAVQVWSGLVCGGFKKGKSNLGFGLLPNSDRCLIDAQPQITLQRII